MEENKEAAEKEKKEVVSEVVAPVEESKPKPEAAVVTGELKESLLDWRPKTQLGRDVLEGRITSIDEILDAGRKILEPQIVDKLVPELKNELILVGGRRGKGGGSQRIPVRITATMHKSGRRFTYSAFVVVGNENGLVGISKGVAPETRDAMSKGMEKAKLNLIKVKRGCGSWECECGTGHSVPYKVTGKSGSVRVELLPAPKGVGLVASDESKKILRLAGIKDIWMKTYGNTSMRLNTITAVFNALKKIYTYERSK